MFEIWSILPHWDDFNILSPMLNFAKTMLDGKVLSLFAAWQLKMEAYPLTGALMAMVASLVAAAWVIYNAALAATSISSTAFMYRAGDNTWA